MSIQKIPPQDLRVKVLEDSDDLSNFNCSIEDRMGLDDFIHSEALDYQKRLLGITYLFLYKGKTIGFVTLAMGNIEIKKTTFKLISSTTIKDYPMLLIARLGTHNDYRFSDVGRNICLWCLALAQNLSKKVGCVGVLVLTQGQNAIKFYGKCSFKIEARYKNMTDFNDKTKVVMYQQIPS